MTSMTNTEWLESIRQKPDDEIAAEIIALYHERWEIELAYDEIKTEMLDREESIRSRTPDGVRQEIWGSPSPTT